MPQQHYRRNPLKIGKIIWFLYKTKLSLPPQTNKKFRGKMRKSIVLSLFALVALSSCVSKKDLLDCQVEFKQVQTNYQDAREKLASLTAQLEAAQKANESLQRALKAQKETNTNLQNSLDKSLVKSNQYIRHLVEVKSKSDSLNLVLQNSLTRSLSKEEMKEVDVQVLKGVVYISLADNMLYESGSYKVNSRASETLSKIAKIIKDHDGYDVLIEGNTDNVPISQTNIRNNWDLSCLRASSVVQEIQNKYGVDPKRLTAGGRGEYNPIVSNNTAVGKQRNRRTQIIITPKLDQFMELIDKAPNE